MDFELDPDEQRVIGCLLEKERTVPDTYPMTLNALRTACNQATGRDPILSLTDAEVTTALDRIRSLGLSRVVHPSHGARQPKYRQVLDDVLRLDGAERAVVTLLLLRGPQTPGELRSRADRLHPFSGLAEVEAALSSLRDRDDPLVRELPRNPGQKEQRWIHLLGPVAQPAPSATTSSSSPSPAGADPTEAVLHDGPTARDEKVRDTYSLVADAYADQLIDELDRKPFDRWLLERLAGEADGLVADVGCGPGQTTMHLALAGADVRGFDLSPGMIAEARRRFPEVPFEVADLRSLPPAPDGADGWALVTAWYALVHLATSELPATIAAMSGALRAGGRLAVAVHEGSEVRTAEDWFDRGTSLQFTFHPREAVLDAFAAAGLVDVEWYLRGPSSPTEAPTHRLYVMGRRPLG